MSNNLKFYNEEDLKAIYSFILAIINDYPNKEAIDETKITVVGGKIITDAIKKQSDTIYTIRDKSLDRRLLTQSVAAGNSFYPMTTYKFHLFYNNNYLNTYMLDYEH